MNPVESIRNLVAENKVGEALDAALNLSRESNQKKYVNALIGLKAQWIELEEQKLSQTISLENVVLYTNKVIKALGSWLDKIEEEITDPQHLINKTKSQLKLVIKEITFYNDELTRAIDPSIKFHLTEKIKKTPGML